MKVNKKIFILLIIFFISLFYFFYVKENRIFEITKIEHQLYKLEKGGWKSKKYVQIIDDINYTAIEVPIQYYILRNKLVPLIT